ncbi:MAG: acetylglutamate kinase [Wenzhouxiangellaceae bacterium]
MSEIRPVIIELLSQMGSSREARQYLQRFSALDTVQFAVIKVGGGILSDQLDELADALSFLRHAGLYPITVHGAGPQLNQALQEAGVNSEIRDGLRVTSPEVMRIVRPIVYQENLRLVEALESRGVRARGLVHGVFNCTELDAGRYGLVGKVEQVHLESVRSALNSHALPIIACLGESDSGQVLNINADSAARALVGAIRPYKIIYLTPTGGMLDEQGRIISAINLETDYDRLMAADWVHSGMRLKLQEIKRLLDDLPATVSVSITSARHLTKELFTHRGAGTLLRKGERIHCHAQLTADDREHLAPLIERCFGRRLQAGYFSSLDLLNLHFADSWQAAAVICRGHGGVPYMDKFVVTPEAQGEGVGAALWQQLRSTYPSMYWRSRSTNPINAWYVQQAERMLRGRDWLSFVYGLDDPGRAEVCLQDAQSRPGCWQDSAEAVA